MLPINQQLSEDQGPQIGAFEAAYELASMDTFVGGLARNNALDEMDGPASKKLSPDDLNSKYKNVAVPFNKPMSEVAAFHLDEEGKKRNNLQRIISEGPKGNFYNQTVNLGASLVAHALDPVEFGSGALLGLGIKGAGALINGSKAAASSSFIAKTGQVLSKDGFLIDAAEGIVGNAALEPFMYDQQSRAQQDYGLDDAFYSVVGGGLAMPALKKAFKSVLGLPDSTVGIAVKNSIGQAQEGFRPTPEIHAKAYNDIAFKNPVEGAPIGSVRAEYKFSPMDSALHQEKTFYMAGASINESKTIGEFLGEGSYLTDNPSFANNIAAHPMDDSFGDVFEVRLNDTKLFDINRPLDPEVLGPLGLSDEASKILADSPTIKQALDNLPDVDREAFIKVLKSSGYDGLSQVDSARGHNAVHLFPEAISKIQEQGRFKPDPKAVPTLNPKDVEAMSAKARSRENELDFDPALDKEFKEFTLPEEFKSMESARIEADMDETLNRMASLEKDGYLSAESKELLESVKQSKLERASKLEVIKDYANCLLSGV
jgi:hypothetical protein